jgi:hypothetical protein
MPIAKSLRRDKEDVECCRRFLDDRNSLRDGEIMDLASRLRSRHIQSVVVQLISNELGWSSRTVVLFLSYADAKSGELVVNEMKEKGMPVGDLVLRLMTDFEGYICLYTIGYLADDSLSRMGGEGDRASQWWLANAWHERGRPNTPRDVWEAAVDAAVKEAQGLVLVK